MYVYKEENLDKDQYEKLVSERGVMLRAVAEGAMRGVDAKWLEAAADIHVKVFGGPRPNLYSNGMPILAMFKNLLRKLEEYGSKNTSSISSTSEPIKGRSKNRKKDH